MTDNINHPAHYNSSPACCSKCGHPIECIDITRHMNFNLGNVLKYIWRMAHKDGVEALEKARWYIADEIKRIKPAPASTDKCLPVDPMWPPKEQSRRPPDKTGYIASTVPALDKPATRIRAFAPSASAIKYPEDQEDAE